MSASTPLLVAAYSRSGSTLLMQLLASSDAVATERIYPYEARYLTYFARWCSLPMAAEKRRDVWNNGTLMTEGDPALMGAFPWKREECEIVPASDKMFSVDAFRAVWETFSSRTPAHSQYYAEKAPLWMADRIGDLLPDFRTLYLLRDPRDVWLSIQAFDRKRGFYGFGRGEDESEEAYLNRFIEDQKPRLERYGAVEESESETVVRYEALASDLDAEAARLSGWLGIELDPDSVRRGEKAMAHHKTSDSSEASMCRWKSELPDSAKETFEERLGEGLRLVGYAD